MEEGAVEWVRQVTGEVTGQVITEDIPISRYGIERGVITEDR